MRIAYITAGAAGMFCGSCMRDNTLVAALLRAGHDAVLIPTYTPIRTDEEDVSQKRIFLGGINVYLEQKFWLFRHTPAIIDSLFNFRWLLRGVSRFAQRTRYSDLGALTISMLQGSHGKQRKEVTRLARWLERHVQPQVIILTNALLSGIVPEIHSRLGVPILVTLQGDDIFLQALPEMDRRRAIELIRENDKFVKGYICTSRDYADRMSGELGLARDKMQVVYPGVHCQSQPNLPPTRTSPPYTIGYFARICPEKGFHQAVDAFIHLRNLPGSPPCRFKASGWLGDNHRRYYEEQLARLEKSGLRADFEYAPSPDYLTKMAFLQSLDVMTVPTIYQEPKGLYVLEAWENGVPVVLPAHGAFPELIEASQAGVLVRPGDTAALADALRSLLHDAELRAEMGRRGYHAVRTRFSADRMAADTVRVISQYLPDAGK